VVVNIAGCLPNWANRYFFNLPAFFLLLSSFYPLYHTIISIFSDTEVLSEAPFSPLSTALDTTVLKASFYITDDLNESFTSATTEPT
jgi:hypothetical protein